MVQTFKHVEMNKNNFLIELTLFNNNYFEEKKINGFIIRYNGYFF